MPASCSLGQLDGKALVHRRGPAAEDGTLHPVQQAMVERHGSQCGFCTPGFVMSLFALYQQRRGRGSTRGQVERRLAGNLCRCTGYRPDRRCGAGRLRRAAPTTAATRGAEDTAERLAALADGDDVLRRRRRSASSPRRRRSTSWRDALRATSRATHRRRRAPTSACGSPSSSATCRRSSHSARSPSCDRDRGHRRRADRSAPASRYAEADAASRARIDPDLGELLRRFGSCRSATPARSAATSPTARRSATRRRR